MTAVLAQVIKANRAGRCMTLPSVCSAHRDVLRAAMLLLEGKGRPLLIEATSNQVNQDGGYTGMTPAGFVQYVHDIAAETGFPEDQILLGGDHLGPQAWKDQSVDTAMDKAKTMVADYVAAGFTKIHLDCSEGCAGEPAHLEDAIVAQRAAELAEVCERAAPNPEALSYIVGTEVPVPGGARADHVGIIPTHPDAATKTMEVHLRAFSPAAADRIVGLVVQPGVEFGATKIDHLPATDQTGLRPVLDAFPGLTFEAHSTDYQHPDAFARLAVMGFAVHKVGPALTFAYRQAIYGLDLVRAVLRGTPPQIASVLEAEMLTRPKYWQGHLSGDAQTQRVLRHYGFSDRIRYYWSCEPVMQAVKTLMDDLSDTDLLEPVLMQYFASEIRARAADLPSFFTYADRLVLATIQSALAPYYLSGGSR